VLRGVGKESFQQRQRLPRLAGFQERPSARQVHVDRRIELPGALVVGQGCRPIRMLPLQFSALHMELGIEWRYFNALGQSDNPLVDIPVGMSMASREEPYGDSES